MNPLISCITATYGRYEILRDVITCFIEQDYENKELIILNNHPVPLFCELPNIKVYNEPFYPTLGLVRKRLLELCNGEYIKIFDDDDLYLPWSLSQCYENIGSDVAWKPYSSWYWGNNKTIFAAQNWFEASYLIKKEILEKYSFGDGAGDENLIWCDAIQKYEGGVKTKEMGILNHYIYRWGHFTSHISAFLGSDSIENRTNYWKSKNLDTGNEKSIKTVNLIKYWSVLFRDCLSQFNNDETELLKNKFSGYGYNFDYKKQTFPIIRKNLDCGNEVNIIAGREPCQMGWYKWTENFYKNRTVLDVGCGSCEGMKLIRKNGAKSVHGQDIDSKLIKLDDNIIINNLDSFNDKSFEVITCFDVLEHIIDDRFFIENLLRIACKYVIITTPNYTRSKCFNHHHCREYAITQFMNFFSPTELWSASPDGSVHHTKILEKVGDNILDFSNNAMYKVNEIPEDIHFNNTIDGKEWPHICGIWKLNE